MKLSLQKRLAAKIMGCSEKRVIFDPARLEDVKEAITKTDIRLLIGEGGIRQKPKKGVSRIRANKRRIQRRKGLRKGEGTRKGKASAHESKKEAWMKRIRAQRKFLKNFKKKGLIKPVIYKELYIKSKGGFFRSINHIKLYMQEHKMFSKPIKSTPKPESEHKSRQKKQAKSKSKTPSKKSSVKRRAVK